MKKIIITSFFLFICLHFFSQIKPSDIYGKNIIAQDSIKGKIISLTPIAALPTTTKNIFASKNDTIYARTGGKWVAISKIDTSVIATKYDLNSKQDTFSFYEFDNKYLANDGQFRMIEPPAGGYANNLYLDTLESIVVPTYRTLNYNVSATTYKQNCTVNSSEGNKVIATYLYPSGVSITTFASGLWTFNFYGKIDNVNGISNLGVQYFARDIGGIETTLFTLWSDEINNTTDTWIKLSTSQPNFTVNATDRMGMRLLAKTDAVTNRTITVDIGDGYGAYLNNPNRIRHSQLRDFNGDTAYLHVRAQDTARWNNIEGQNIFISKTYSEIYNLINDSLLNVGVLYKITDRGDRGIFLKALNNSKLSYQGYRIMLCPANYDMGVDAFGNNWKGCWSEDSTYSINDLAIWAGRVWKNVAGNTGVFISYEELDEEWELIEKTSFTNHEYQEIVCTIKYDFSNDLIVYQSDIRGNVVSIQLGDEETYINNSDWNNPSCYNNILTQGFYSNATGAIYNNICEYIIGNSCSSIYDNKAISSIASNKIPGQIARNKVLESISNNQNAGDIEDNDVYTIYNNSNNGTISLNEHAEIMNNTNGGTIIGNISFSINSNSNAGNIRYNIVYYISSNSNLGDIEWNRNNGSIISNSSGANPCNITYNINNGDIQGVRTTHVTDTRVDK